MVVFVVVAAEHRKKTLASCPLKATTKMGKKNSKLKQDTIDRLTTATYCKLNAFIIICYCYFNTFFFVLSVTIYYNLTFCLSLFCFCDSSVNSGQLFVYKNILCVSYSWSSYDFYFNLVHGINYWLETFLVDLLLFMTLLKMNLVEVSAPTTYSSDISWGTRTFFFEYHDYFVYTNLVMD